MQVVKLSEKFNDPLIVCLGYFGCMHKGHVELLKTAKLRAEERNAKIAIFTFTNNHLKVLGKDSAMLYSFEERLSIYGTLGVDVVIASEFDKAFREMRGNEFLDKLNKFDLRGIVCGFDYRCGSDGVNCYGVKQFFSNVCSVDIVNQISVGNEKISTTMLKRLLEERRIDEVNALLSEPYFIQGTVAKGRGVGKVLGFPTANIETAEDKLLPVGVYGGTTVVDGKEYRCIVNIGQIPTFGIMATDVEAHLLSFDGNLYGKTLKISLTRYLRDIRKFDNGDLLAKQLQKDKEKVLND